MWLNHRGWWINDAWIFHLFKLSNYYGEVRETDVISIWYYHTGWWINGVWIFHMFENRFQQYYDSLTKGSI